MGLNNNTSNAVKVFFFNLEILFLNSFLDVGTKNALIILLYCSKKNVCFTRTRRAKKGTTSCTRKIKIVHSLVLSSVKTSTQINI